MSIIKIEPKIIDKVIKLSQEAGKAILDIYNSDTSYKIKSDNSPLTKADLTSNKIITDYLKKLTPSIPILSEEESKIPFKIRSSWDEYWLIDPLDGTKEFIKKNGEFTVNIALINKSRPIFGVIYIPVTGEIFWGSKYNGSFTKKDGMDPIQINTNTRNDRIRIVTSRSHSANELEYFTGKIKKYETISVGSSIKFCLIANGKADIYLRLGKTSEWDTAAGDAILRYAGGNTVNFKNESLIYNSKASLINPAFIATSNKLLSEKIIKASKIL